MIYKFWLMEAKLDKEAEIVDFKRKGNIQMYVMTKMKI